MIVQERFPDGRFIRAFGNLDGIQLPELVAFLGADREAKVFKALRERWGFGSRDVIPLAEVAEEVAVDPDDLFYADVALVQRLGLRVDVSPALKRQWMEAKSPV